MLTLTIASDDGLVIEVRGAGEVSQVRFHGKDNPLEKLLGPEGYARKVLFNFEAVEFLDSSGIGWLVVCNKNFRQKGGKLVLYNLPPLIDQVLRYCRMEQLLHLAADSAEARQLLM